MGKSLSAPTGLAGHLDVETGIDGVGGAVSTKPGEKKSALIEVQGEEDGEPTSHS